MSSSQTPQKPDETKTSLPPTTSETRQKALQLIAEMIPNWDAEAQLAAPKKFGSDLDVLAVDQAFGGVWQRDGLDRKTRSLITVSMLIGGGNINELQFHIPSAVRNGVTLEELEEVILHATVYCGFPAAASTRKVAISALKDAGFL
jgi:4-carboxymuconolactone decarboxylase